MKIYVRDEEGLLTPLEIITIKGDKGEKGDTGENGVTPNIQIGEVTTLEPGEMATVSNSGTTENPVLNFGIPRGADNGIIIDDSTTSKTKTWSSEKIEDYVLTNVGAIWQEINGGQVAISNTMDGFLRDVEILGNTIQNKEDLSNIQHLGVWNEEKQGYEIEITVSNSSSSDDLNYQEYKTTIILPCQLMKVGDVSDRLYWDIIKGRYVVEKYIGTTNLPLVCNKNSVLDTSVGGCKYSDTFYNVDEWNKSFTNIGLPGATFWEAFQHSLGKPMMLIRGTQIQSHYHNVWMNGSIKSGKILSISNQGTTTVQVIFRDIECMDVEQMNQWVKTFEGKEVYYTSLVAQLIDTDIREQIKLPTFMNNTYLKVTGGIEGTIKAKAPIDGGEVINTIIETNVVLQQEVDDLKTVNESQDLIINQSLLVTDQMLMMMEPLMVDEASILNTTNNNAIVNLYVMMIQRGLKKEEEVPLRYREEVSRILAGDNGE